LLFFYFNWLDLLGLIGKKYDKAWDFFITCFVWFFGLIARNVIRHYFLLFTFMFAFYVLSHKMQLGTIIWFFLFVGFFMSSRKKCNKTLLFGSFLFVSLFGFARIAKNAKRHYIFIFLFCLLLWSYRKKCNKT